MRSLADMTETSFEPEMAHQRASEWLRNPPILDPIGSILRVGEVPRLEAPSVERKLAAIFAADVEGYNRLMGRDKVVREVT
jgi:class 3 adenylate cyclase